MVERASRLALVLLVPLLLGGCFLAPGKFTSTLLVNADRTFTFTYVGEVYGFNPDEAMKGLGDDDDEDQSKTALKRISYQKDDGNTDKDDAREKESTDAQFREMAAALTREKGFRKAEYVGDNKFLIDYQITGTLDHTFLFPYNLDGGVIIPFVAIEVRANGTVRVKAPGFAKEGKETGGMGGLGSGSADKTASRLDGVFTLDTDAEIVSQNNEDGVKKAGGRSVIAWKATPLSSTAPMAVLRMKDVPAVQ